MANKMIACKSCGADIAASAKTCPKCGAKNKKPIYRKWWFYVIILIFLLGIGGTGGRTTGTTTTNSTEVSSTTTNKSTQDSKEEINYAHYNVTELFDALKSNAMKAQETFKDKYVELEGYLGTIDSNGKYIGLGAAEDNYEYILQEVQCYIKTAEQKSAIMEMNRGDPMIVKGKITRIGEVLGYTLDIDSIG